MANNLEKGNFYILVCAVCANCGRRRESFVSPLSSSEPLTVNNFEPFWNLMGDAKESEGYLGHLHH